METPASRKFMFDKSFDGLVGGKAAAPERKPVTLKPDQFDALKKENFDAGFAAGQKAGIDQQMQALAALLAQVEKRIADMTNNMQALLQQQDAQMRGTVMAIARKILPDFTARNGLQEINAIIADVIGEMVHEPRLVVRIHETQFDAVNTKIHEITIQKAYAGKVVVLADPEIAAGDCRVEWADGGIERNTEATWRDVEKLVTPTTDQTPTEAKE